MYRHRNVKPKDRRNTKTLLVALAMHGITLRKADAWPLENSAKERHFGSSEKWQEVSIYALKNGRYRTEMRRRGEPNLARPERKTFRQALVEALYVIENND